MSWAPSSRTHAHICKVTACADNSNQDSARRWLPTNTSKHDCILRNFKHLTMTDQPLGSSFIYRYLVICCFYRNDSSRHHSILDIWIPKIPFIFQFEVVVSIKFEQFQAVPLFYSSSGKYSLLSAALYKINIKSSSLSFYPAWFSWHGSSLPLPLQVITLKEQSKAPVCLVTIFVSVHSQVSWLDFVQQTLVSRLLGENWNILLISSVRKWHLVENLWLLSHVIETQHISCSTEWFVYKCIQELFNFFREPVTVSMAYLNKDSNIFTKLFFSIEISSHKARSGLKQIVRANSADCFDIHVIFLFVADILVGVRTFLYRTLQHVALRNLGLLLFCTQLQCIGVFDASSRVDGSPLPSVPFW